MAVLLSGAALSKSFGARILFENLSLSLSEGDRTGLIGPNGSGKTTLMEILAGREAPSVGVRAVRKQTSLAYVPQDSLFGPDDTVGSVLTTALAGLSGDDHEKTARKEMIVGRAGFETTATPAAALSGGWRKRLAIAAALVASPDVLLLDEPTNHLDLEGILWLESAIRTVNACLVITHDRYFLENVATRMVEVNPVYPESSFQVKGNYSEFLERREEFLEAQAKQQESLATKVRREVEWLRRGPKARTGKSRARVDAAGRLIEELSAVTTRSRTATAKIDFTASDRKTKRLIEAEGIGKTLGGLRLFQHLNLTLSPGVRIGLVGPNGSGKTTLLKILQGDVQPDEGSLRRADRLEIVSFAQDRGAHLDLEISLRRMLCPEGDSVMYRGRPIHVAAWAKRFLFRDEHLEMPMSRLSGGERARAMIARLMLSTADVLLLDEPTNDLDIPTLRGSGGQPARIFRRHRAGEPRSVFAGPRFHHRNRSEWRGDGGVFADYSQWEASRNEQPAPRSIAKERRAFPRSRKGPRRSWPISNSVNGMAWKRKSLRRNGIWPRGTTSCKRPRRMRNGRRRLTKQCRKPSGAWRICTHAGRSWNPK